MRLGVKLGFGYETRDEASVPYHMLHWVRFVVAAVTVLQTFMFE